MQTKQKSIHQTNTLIWKEKKVSQPTAILNMKQKDDKLQSARKYLLLYYTGWMMIYLKKLKNNSFKIKAKKKRMKKRNKKNGRKVNEPNVNKLKLMPF